MSNVINVRQGYKHTPLGWVPEEWHIISLDEVSEIQQGVSKGREIPADAAIQVPYMRVANVKDGYLDFSEIKTIAVRKGEEDKYRLALGDVLITEGGDLDKLGRGAIWKEDLATCVFQNHLFRIRANPEILSPEYFYCFIQGRRAKSYFLSCAKRTTGIASINSSQVRALPVMIPALDEQQAIVSVLSSWGAAITITQQIIAQLQKRNKGLMQQLLTPADNWQEYRLGDLLKEVRRPVQWNDEELYRLISVRRRSGGAFYRESLYGKQILTKQLFTAEEGDFLISKMQIVHGASAVVPKELGGMKISGSYIAVHAKDESVLDINFFNWLSKTRWFYRLTYISSYGVHIEKMTFDFDDFKKRKILVPPTIDQQKKIVAVLQAAVNEVLLLEKRLDALKLQKKGLMQKLLTGEIRVPIPTEITCA